MALNFPITPADGDTYQGYVYDATAGVWNSDPHQIASRFVTSATAPSSPSEGDGWFDTNTAKSYVYYDGVWVQLGALGTVDLNQIADVSVSSPANGESLVYDGTDWTNQNVSVDVYDVSSDSTGKFALPKGTTAQRPVTPNNGDIRFNTESEEPEWYSATAGQWIKFRLSPSQDFEYLVIAGGGGAGGHYSGGGGGAGGYRSSVEGQLSGGLSSAESKLSFSAGDVFSVIVGAGGAGSTSSSGSQLDGSKGSESILTSIVSVGGGAGPGGGRTLLSSLKDGGSGGGASGNVANNIGGLPTTNQGFAGGNASTNGANYGAAGGGGAGQAGQGGTLSSNGAGGDGIFSNITGTSIQRGGGGGAGAHTPLIGALGGAGGGGNGGQGGNISGDSGLISTGGGGGGASYSAGAGAAGGSGGSGIVVVRYPATMNLTIGGGLTFTTTVVGDKKVTQFTAGTDQVTVG